MVSHIVLSCSHHSMYFAYVYLRKEISLNPAIANYTAISIKCSSGVINTVKELSKQNIFHHFPMLFTHLYPHSTQGRKFVFLMFLRVQPYKLVTAFNDLTCVSELLGEQSILNLELARSHREKRQSLCHVTGTLLTCNLTGPVAGSQR